MYLHDKPREILTRLNENLEKEISELSSWKKKVVDSQDFSLAIEFKDFIVEIETLNNKIKDIINGNAESQLE
jgi:hypothetical protein